MKGKIIALFIVLVILAGITYGSYRWYEYETTPGQYDDFAKCLSRKARMYGTDWCKYCQRQKKKFGKSFEYVNFINCDYEKRKCLNNGVEGYPTWIINGEKYSGVQQLGFLAEKTGCELD